MEKRNVAWKSERSEQRNIGFDRCQKEMEDVRLSWGRMQVSAVGPLCNFLAGVCKYLIDIF